MGTWDSLCGVFGGGVFFIAIALCFFLHFIPVHLYITAWAAGVHVSLGHLVQMRFRKVPPERIINPLIMSSQAGIYLSIYELEDHYLAGGNVDNVVSAVIAANKAGINLSLDKARTIDLAGRDVLDAVKMSVNPKIMKTALIEAMAQDGIQVKAICQVTVRANIDKLIGGAGEETVLARVGEGIVTAIGSAGSHKEVLENPEIISEAVQSKGLDAGTAFEILSIDIADVDVGKNIGAQLQLDRANADKQIAQALAEKRRSQAIARSQEMKALVEEAKSKLIEAQAEVPKALAQALAEGKFSVLDYYDMQNIIADTKMREAIAVYGQGRQASS